MSGKKSPIIPHGIENAGSKGKQIRRIKKTKETEEEGSTVESFAAFPKSFNNSDGPIHSSSTPRSSRKTQKMKIDGDDFIDDDKYLLEETGGHDVSENNRLASKIMNARKGTIKGSFVKDSHTTAATPPRSAASPAQKRSRQLSINDYCKNSPQSPVKKRTPSEHSGYPEIEDEITPEDVEQAEKSEKHLIDLERKKKLDKKKLDRMRANRQKKISEVRSHARHISGTQPSQNRERNASLSSVDEDTITRSETNSRSENRKSKSPNSTLCKVLAQQREDVDRVTEVVQLSDDGSGSRKDDDFRDSSRSPELGEPEDFPNLPTTRQSVSKIDEEIVIEDDMMDQSPVVDNRTPVSRDSKDCSLVLDEAICRSVEKLCVENFADEAKDSESQGEIATQASITTVQTSVSPRIDDDLSIEDSTEDFHVSKLKSESTEMANEILHSALKIDSVMEPDLYRVDSSNGHIFFRVNTLSDDQPPAPFPNEYEEDMKFHDSSYISLPWDSENIRSDGCRNWKRISFYLEILAGSQEPSIQNILACIRVSKPNADLDHLKSELESNLFDFSIFSKMAALALRGPELFRKPIPKLQLSPGKQTISITLSQEQCACLLANAFYCTFPERQEREKMNAFNMTHLFGSNYSVPNKLRFIIRYFKQVMQSMPAGCVSFRRVTRIIKPPGAGDWSDENIISNSKKTLPRVGVHLKSMENGKPKMVEDCDSCLQMDFANKFIGGGTLGSGCVQEEIRFLCCPEMIVSMLLAPVMRDSEAIFIVGAQTFSNYTGYAQTVRRTKLRPEQKTPLRDKFNRVVCEVVAIDALKFSGHENQFEKIDREILKAYAGFYTNVSQKRPVATGNWGCGVFGGNLELKSLVQVMAAGECGRDVVYLPFNSDKFGVKLFDFCKRMKDLDLTIGELYNLVKKYRRCSMPLFQFIDNQVLRRASRRS